MVKDNKKYQILASQIVEFGKGLQLIISSARKLIREGSKDGEKLKAREVHRVYCGLVAKQRPCRLFEVDARDEEFARQYPHEKKALRDLASELESVAYGLNNLQDLMKSSERKIYESLYSGGSEGRISSRNGERFEDEFGV